MLYCSLKNETNHYKNLKKNMFSKIDRGYK